MTKRDRDDKRARDLIYGHPFPGPHTGHVIALMNEVRAELLEDVVREMSDVACDHVAMSQLPEKFRRRAKRLRKEAGR